MSAPEGTVQLIDTPADLLQAVSFRLHNEVYALDILHVQEIIKPLPVTEVPHAPPWIAGVINLRGQILPLIHLARCLALEGVPLPRTTRFMIVRSREQPVGLVVDEVLEVLRLSGDALEPPPAHLAHRELIHGVSKQERGMVIVLDLAKVLYFNAARGDTPQEAL